MVTQQKRERYFQGEIHSPKATTTKLTNMMKMLVTALWEWHMVAFNTFLQLSNVRQNEVLSSDKLCSGITKLLRNVGERKGKRLIQ